MELIEIAASVAPAIEGFEAESPISKESTSMGAADEPLSAEFTDSMMFRLLRDFNDGSKPMWAGAVEIGIVNLLLLRKAVDHPVKFSLSTLARSLGVSEASIRRAAKLLAARGWITTGSRKGLSKLWSVNIDRLPLADRSLPTKPKEIAVQLRKRYLNALVKLKVKLPHKKQRGTQDWTAQKIINRCEDNIELAAKIIGFALGKEPWSKYARKDLQTLYSRWEGIEDAYRLREEQNRAMPITSEK
jgi:hypothetical protein